MLQLINIKKSFDGKPILTNVNLSVDAGERISIIGASGCGKSTILKIILGLIPPDEGKVIFQGKDIFQLSESALRDTRRDLALLFQYSALFDSMSVQENIAFSLEESDKLFTPREVDRQVDKYLEMVEMTEFKKAMPSALSGGQKKRVGLARAIAKKPKLILYDEPTTGLDPVLSTNIEDLMVKLSSDLSMTSIVVTHQISTMLRTTDKIYFLKQGEFLEPESPKTIFKSKQDIIKSFVNGEAS
jgi:phospholipid/cholesterol/gamma-HCH transport system ATP-binding protein